MEVKIGIQNIGREIVLESTQDADAVAKVARHGMSKAKRTDRTPIRRRHRMKGFECQGDSGRTCVRKQCLDPVVYAFAGGSNILRCRRNATAGDGDKSSLHFGCLVYREATFLKGGLPGAGRIGGPEPRNSAYGVDAETPFADGSRGTGDTRFFVVLAPRRHGGDPKPHTFIENILEAVLRPDRDEIERQTTQRGWVYDCYRLRGSHETPRLASVAAL